jgi:hypothetical protein
MLSEIGGVLLSKQSKQFGDAVERVGMLAETQTSASFGYCAGRFESAAGVYPAWVDSNELQIVSQISSIRSAQREAGFTNQHCIDNTNDCIDLDARDDTTLSDTNESRTCAAAEKQMAPRFEFKGASQSGRTVQPTADASGSTDDARSGTTMLPPVVTLTAAQVIQRGRVDKTDTKLSLAKGNFSTPVRHASSALQVPPFEQCGSTNCGKIKAPPWSKSEVQSFKQIIERDGLGNWEKKAQRMPGRTASALQTFWHRHLDPGFKDRIREQFSSGKPSHNSQNCDMAVPASHEHMCRGKVTAITKTMEKTDANERGKHELNRAREQSRAGDSCSGCGAAWAAAAGRTTGRHWHRGMGNVPRLQVCTECNDEALLRQRDADRTSDPKNVADHHRSCSNCAKNMGATDLAATCCVGKQDGCGRTVCSGCTIRVFGEGELQRAKSCGSFVGAGRCVGTYVCPGCRRDRHLHDSFGSQCIGSSRSFTANNNGAKVGSHGQ